MKHITIFAIALTWLAISHTALAVSQNGTGFSISQIGIHNQIIDASNATYTLNADKTVSRSGVKDTATDITSLLYFNGSVYRATSKMVWSVYQNNAWVARNSLGDPRVTSIVGSEVMPGSKTQKLTYLIDAPHNTFTLGTDGTVYRNGYASATGAIGMLYANNMILYWNSSYSWFYFNTATSAWAPRNALGDPRVTSANNSTVAVSGSYLIDSGRNLFLLSNNKVYLNGQLSGTATDIEALYFFNGVMYEKNSAHLIWSYTNGAWVGANSVEFALPDQVKAVGYTYPTFIDEFNDLSTIDINNTLKAGYNWYVVNHSDGHVTEPSHLTYKNVNGISVLRLDGSNSSIFNAAKVGSTQLGKSFSIKNNGGAYYEANIAYGDSYSIHDSPYAWPAFWASSTEHQLSETDSWVGEVNTKITHYIEVDIMEYFTGNDGPTGGNFNSTLIDWYGQYNVATPACTTLPYCKQQDTQSIGAHKQGVFTSTEEKPVFHKYGALYIPSVLNSATGKYSTGSIQFFLDGAPVGHAETWVGGEIPKSETTPVSPWRYSITDQNALSMILNTDGGAFMYVDYAAVWQLP